MATVRQTLALQDKMSPVLSKIMSAMHSTINVMEQMNTAAGRGINPAQFARTRAEILGAENALNDLRNTTDKLDGPTERARQGFSGWQAAIVTANQAVQLLRSGIQGLGTVTGFFDSLSSTSSRVKLVNDGLQEQNELQQKIFESAQRSRASYQETASTVAKLNLLAGNQFASNEEAIAFAETMNKAFVISGADTSEQSAAMRQMSQAMASGRLQGDEYNSIIENAPLVAQAIEKYMGVSRGKLKELASEGAITADIIKEAVFNASEEINTQFAEMPMKFGDHMTSLKNKGIQALEPLTTRFSNFMNSDQFKGWVAAAEVALGNAVAWVGELVDKIAILGQSAGAQALISQLGMLVGILAWAVEFAVSFGVAVIDNWQWIGPIVWGIVAAMVAYKTITGILTAVELAKNAVFLIGLGISAAKTGMTLAEAAATMTDAEAKKYATAQQWALNSATYAFPGMWIIMIIIAIIAAIYLVIGVINKLTGESISATGIILGALATAGAFVWDLFLGILELVIGVFNFLVNPIIAWVNFFANVFNDPIGSVIHLFGDLADNVLGILQKIASAMDMVFGSNMAGTVQGWRNSLKAKVDTAAKEYGNGEYEKVMSALDFGVEDLGLKRIEYSDAWAAGYSAGETVDESIGSITDKIFGGIDMSAIEEATKQASPGSDFDPSQYTSGDGFKVDASGSEVSLSDEDIKYLKDVAKLEYVNQYTTLRPTVQATFGDIHETTDVNQVMQVFEDAIAEAYSSSLGKG